TTPCQIDPYPSTEARAATDVDTVMQQLGLIDPNTNDYLVTGWTINPNWTPQTGGTLATKTVTATEPQPPSEPGAADSGSVTATQTWELTTRGGAVARSAGRALSTQPSDCGLTITSPPADSTLALTDSKYFEPQPGTNDRQPEERNLTVEGTAPPGVASVTL